MNGWCSEKTNGLITKHFEDVKADIAVILNAMYFKAPWNEELFNSENTRKEIFHGYGKDVEVEMMKSGSYSQHYSSDGDFEYLCMGFGNLAYLFRIILPAEGMSLDRASELLTPERVNSLIADSRNRSVVVKMPKFKLDYKYDLNGMLEKVEDGALLYGYDFTMFDKKVDAGIIYSQSASFSIDETGAEAAAVTSGEIFLV